MSYRIIVIRDMSEYFGRVEQFAQGSEELWFRGNKFHDYSLEPSAYRTNKFPLSSKDVEQQSIMTARSDMYHIPETARLNLTLDWLCYLQHNGTPTRLLDWSTKFDVAIHFAFEAYIDGTATPGSLPCIWVLKPA